MRSRISTNSASVQRACIFVDYQNLYDYIDRNATDRTQPRYAIHTLLNSALHHVREELGFYLDNPVAYADFALIGSSSDPDIQQSLYLAGLEPRFVPASLQTNASEIQICVDVLDLLQKQTDVQAIFLITGERLYLPLLKFCQRKNVRSVAITFQPPGINYAGEHSDLFIHADKFMTQTVPAHPGEDDTEDPSDPVHPSGLTNTPENVSEITEETVRIALEVIEHFFGRYEEIYLTPLLRKLSDMFGDHDDPKEIVGKLSDAGAVWLEKRKGFPFNYTVLLINYDHPNVIAIHEEIMREEKQSDEEVDYEKVEDYPEENYNK